jgi:hypothetical protein
MAITFKSKMQDVTMLDAHAKQVLEIIGKDFAARGVITAGEAGAAAAKLRAAGAASKAQGKGADSGDGENGEGSGDRVPAHVRYLPFTEMLESAAKANHDILWGV